MPKKMETELREAAKKKYPKDKKKQDAYVYGAMRRRGWTPRAETTEVAVKKKGKPAKGVKKTTVKPRKKKVGRGTGPGAYTGPAPGPRRRATRASRRRACRR